MVGGFCVPLNTTTTPRFLSGFRWGSSTPGGPQPLRPSLCAALIAIRHGANDRRAFQPCARTKHLTLNCKFASHAIRTNTRAINSRSVFFHTRLFYTGGKYAYKSKISYSPCPLPATVSYIILIYQLHRSASQAPISLSALRIIRRRRLIPLCLLYSA